jgi:hypothetical protein
MAAAVLLVYGFVTLETRSPLRSSNVLVCLGRASLTILIVHVAVIREAAIHFDFWRSLSLPGTIAATGAVLIFFAVVAVWWRKIGFRYGAEWLLRRVAG